MAGTLTSRGSSRVALREFSPGESGEQLKLDDESRVTWRMRAPRPPPGAVNSGPVAAACAAAVAYFAYSVHYSSANVGSSANATKTAPWWKPSN